MAQTTLEHLDSYRPGACFWTCDVCGALSVDDCLGREVRPFYAAEEGGRKAVVCVECLDDWTAELFTDEGA